MSFYAILPLSESLHILLIPSIHFQFNLLVTQSVIYGLSFRVIYVPDYIQRKSVAKSAASHCVKPERVQRKIIRFATYTLKISSHPQDYTIYRCIFNCLILLVWQTVGVVFPSYLTYYMVKLIIPTLLEKIYQILDPFFVHFSLTILLIPQCIFNAHR